MATFNGTAASETITPAFVSTSVGVTPAGTRPGAGNDLIFAGDGHDTVEGGGGNDTVLLGPGNDAFTWRLNDGSDSIEGGEGIDRVNILRGTTNDEFEIVAIGDRVSVEIGDVVAATMAGVEQIAIVPGFGQDDVILSDLGGTGVTLVDIDLASGDTGLPDRAADDVEINGSDGDDTFRVSIDDGSILVDGFGPLTRISNPDRGANGIRDSLTLKGAGGADTLDLSGLPDDVGMSFVLYGGDGNDALTGGAGNDGLFGDEGADLLAGGLGADWMVGASGFTGDDTEPDTASYTASNAAVTVNLVTGTGAGGHAEGDVLLEIENLVGSRFADSLTGNAAANRLNGGGGADVLAAGTGDDTYVVDDAGDRVIEAAGEGIDTVISSVAVTLGANVENLRLTDGAAGGAAPGRVAATGNALANVIAGNGSANTIAGKEGDDILTGGGGADRFVFDTKPLRKGGNLDHITDFAIRSDKIVLDDDVFRKLDAGKLDKEALSFGKRAREDDDRVVYDKASGVVAYDKDGSGGAKAVAFAILDGSPDGLKARDFLIIA